MWRPGSPRGTIDEHCRVSSGFSKGARWYHNQHRRSSARKPSKGPSGGLRAAIANANRDQTRQLLNTLLVVFPILCLCVVIFRAVVRNADVVNPNSETESAFLRSYTIENAIKSGIPFWSSLSGPNSAGRGCAFHQRKF